MTCEARWGLKLVNIDHCNARQGYVGMTCEARWGLKQLDIIRLLYAQQSE